MSFVVYLNMGNRQLALAVGAITAIIGLAIAAIRMKLELFDGVGIAATAILFIASSIVMIVIGKRKWELDYKNAFILLFSTSVLCSLIYAIGYPYVQDNFQSPALKVDAYSFTGLFVANLIFKLFVDLVAAIFYKR